MRLQRIGSLIVALMMGIAWVPPAVSGETVAAADVEKGKNVSAASGAEEMTYRSYFSSYGLYRAAEQDLTVRATDYTENRGAAVTPAMPEGAERTVLSWTGETGSLVYTFDVPRDGLYQLAVTYCPLPGRSNGIEIGVKLDGAYCFSEMAALTLPRQWRDKGTVRVDDNGNEFAPEQEQVFGTYTHRLSDPGGLEAEPYVFAFSRGRHTVELISVAEPFALDSLTLAVPQTASSYNDLTESYRRAGYADGYEVRYTAQGEAAILKTEATMAPQSDPTSPDVEPSSPRMDKINYIGGTNWQEPGDRITWEIEVPRDGLYSLAFRYRQNYVLNASVYRRLLVDGAVPYAEAAALPYAYRRSWTFEPVTCGEETAKLYLTAGKHTVSLEVTLGPVAEISEQLENTVYTIGKRYRDMIMITGDTPDANRDYNLFEQIPELEASLTEIRDSLNALAEKLETINGKTGGSNVATMRSMVACIEQMLRRPYYAQRYISDYYSNYCSVGSLLYNVKNMPLDIDKLVVYSPDQTFSEEKAGFFRRAAFSAERFFASFTTDYNAVSQAQAGKDSLTLWVNWGRDQVQMLNFLVKDSFEETYQTKVNIRIVNASMIQAILSGKGPDCSLQLSRTQPVNLAMRGALCDLSEMEGFEAVKTRFNATAMTPYYLKGKCYALPDTQQFYMLFYRTDIFEELNLKVPQTWDEFLNVLIVLERYNMQVGIPYTQISDMSQTDLGVGALNLFPTVLLQRGAALYKPTLAETNLLSAEAVSAFTFWTNLYTKYGLPVTYDFYNRFRTGQMPMAIAPYMQYSTLSVAAPEINNCWDMAVLPGVKQADGTVNYSEAGSGTGAVILKTAQNKEAAWKFLTWWTDAETQYRYTTGVESVLGVAARNPTSNVEAFSRLSWKKDGLKTLQKQWQAVQELPEVPGGYFVSRVIDQAFWSTVNENENPKDALLSWGKIANQEIQRKENEYYANR